MKKKKKYIFKVSKNKIGIENKDISLFPFSIFTINILLKTKIYYKVHLYL